MENRAHALAAVSFLIIFCVGAALIFYWLSSGPAAPRVYRIVTSQSVAGLAPQSAVMFKGLQVGHVQSIGFDPQDHSRVIVDFRVQPDAYITESTYAVVALKGLIGGKVLELKLGEGSEQPLETSATNPAHIPLRKGTIGHLKTAAQQSLHQLHTLLANVNALLSKKNRKHISAAIRQLDTLTEKLITLEKQLTPAIKQLPELLAGMSKTLEQTRALVASARQLIKKARVPVKKAANVEETIQQVGHSLNRQILPDVHELTRSLTRTSRMLQDLVRLLEVKPQSVIFGPPKPRPGPGEPGFEKPSK